MNKSNSNRDLKRISERRLYRDAVKNFNRQNEMGTAKEVMAIMDLLKYANENALKLAKFRGITAVLVTKKIGIPENLNVYGIRHSDEDAYLPVNVESHVAVNRWGYLVTFLDLEERMHKDIIPDGRGWYIPLSDNESHYFTGELNFR